MTDFANPIAGVAGDDQLEAGRVAQGFSRGPDFTLLQREPRIHLAWLIVPCLAADGLMVPALRLLDGGPPGEFGALFAFGIVGCVLAQGNLLAAWLVWGDEPFLRRLLTHWKIAAGLYLIWLVGMVLALRREREMPQVAATVALAVPLVSLAAQFPLWVARQLFGWRLVRENADTSREQRLSIRDLMVATLVVAASLALVRLAPFQKESERWAACSAFFTVASVISTIALLPAGSLLLRLPALGRGLKWSALYAAAWISLPWILVAALRWYGSVNLPPRPLFVGLSSLMFTFAATLTLTAVIARDRGYRLAGGRLRPDVARLGARSSELL